MKSSRSLAAAVAIFFAIPAFSATISFTAGCTAPIPVTATVTFGDFGSPNTTDPGGHATYSGGTFNSGTIPCNDGAFLTQIATSTTISFDVPVSYFGFAWGTPDPTNSISVYNGLDLIFTYVANTNGAYANITAGPGEQFTSVVMTSTQCCFETDNHSYVVADIAGVPEPTTLYPTVLSVAAGLGFIWKRRRKSNT